MRVAFVLASGVPLCAAQTTGAGVDAPAPLATLVREAMARNLSIEAARFTPDIAAADIQAAQGAFDAEIQFRPAFGRTTETVRTAGGQVASSTWTTALDGGAGGLLPYSATTVVGNLPTGTQYSVSLQSARQGQSTREGGGQGYPGLFDTDLTLSIAQPLLRGAGRAIARAPIQAATLGAGARRAGLARAIDETIAEVEEAYWTAVYARALERVAEESLERARTLLARNQQLLELQLAANIDVLTARQGVAAREATLTETRQQRADAADAVVFLVYGRDAAARVDIPLDLEAMPLPERVPELPDADRALAEAVGLRPDLREAELQVDRARIDVAVTRDSLRPSLNVAGSYTAFTNNASTIRPFGASRLGEVASAAWEGSVQLTLPIGNNVAKAAAQQAALVERQQQTAVAAVRSRIAQDVRQAQRAIQMSGDLVRQTTEALQIALEEYEAENQRLQLGLSDSFRLLQFEETINDAQQAQLQARYRLALATVSFGLARGASAVTYGVALPGVPARGQR